MIFSDALKIINKNNSKLISSLIINSNDSVINTAIFPEGIPNDIKVHKENYFQRLEENKKNLLFLKENPFSDFSDIEKKVIENEINYSIDKINFLKLVYNIEANKLSKDFKLSKELIDIDYDYYNKTFYGVSLSDLKGKTVIKNIDINESNLIFPKEKLLELLEFTKSFCRELQFEFGNYVNLSHGNGILYIPDKETYNLRTFITIFFHELTHFFRYKNGINNLGFSYSFSSYSLLEEGIAIYNEYYYGNKIIKYGKYNPYLEKCYKILLTNHSTKKKKELIYSNLSKKFFSKEKANNYYFRLYKYSELGSKKFFFKDLIYSKGYKKVAELIKNDKTYYNKIMSGRIGIENINSGIINSNNNIDSKFIFKQLQKKLISLL